MKQIFSLISICFCCSMYAQMSINERIDNQLKIYTFDEEEGTKIVPSFQDRELQENILDYKPYIGYIFTHFKDKSIKKGLTVDNQTDPEIAIEAYRERLKRDTLFVNTLQRISDNSAKAIQDKPAYDFDKIMDIAVKFIKIIDSDKEGSYVLKVCVGVNDLGKTQTERYADIEAFCFMTILYAYLNEERPLKDEIENEFYKVADINMGIDKEERILRAQGALIVLMHQNQALKKALVEEYETNKEILPFSLTNVPTL